MIGEFFKGVGVTAFFQAIFDSPGAAVRGFLTLVGVIAGVLLGSAFAFSETPFGKTVLGVCGKLIHYGPIVLFWGALIAVGLWLLSIVMGD